MKMIDGYPDYMIESIKLVEKKREKNMKNPVKPMSMNDREEMLAKYHPDYMKGTKREVRVGPNKGEFLYNGIADLLESKPVLDPTDVDLSKIDFDKLSMGFFVDDKGSGLKKIHLISEDLDVQGYFTLFENDLVSGKVSLMLTKEVLKGSSKFAPLMRRIGKDISLVNFDFQLSSPFQAMNFKWLESEFKQRLQDYLPSRWETRIEKGLESEIEEIIESISRDQN